MANITSGPQKFVISAVNTFVIGATDSAFVGTFHVHLVSSSFSGSVTVKARSAQKDASVDSVPFVTCNYLNTYVNGAVGDQTYVNTAITTTSEILIPASGRQIVLDCTSYTSGTLTAYITPLIGAAA